MVQMWTPWMTVKPSRSSISLQSLYTSIRLGAPSRSTGSASGRSRFKDPRGYQSAKADRALVVMVLMAVTLVLIMDMGVMLVAVTLVLLVHVFRLVAVVLVVVALVLFMLVGMVLVAVAFVLVVRQSLLLIGGMG